MLFSETLSLAKVPLRMQISFVSLFGQAVGPLSCVPSVGGFPSVCPVLQPFALLLWVHRMHSSPWTSFQTQSGSELTSQSFSWVSLSLCHRALIWKALGLVLVYTQCWRTRFSRSSLLGFPPVLSDSQGYVFLFLLGE